MTLDMANRGDESAGEETPDGHRADDGESLGISNWHRVWLCFHHQVFRSQLESVSLWSPC